MVTPRTGAGKRGSLSLPCSALLLVICLAGFGTWSLMRRWRMLMELQLRLDRCVGEAALRFKSLAEKADRSNTRMRWERRTAPAEAALARDGGAALKALILAEFTLQEGLEASWEGVRLQWLARGGCGASGDRPLPLPGMEWRRDAPDEWGPQPFEWSRLEFRISVFHPPRAAAAWVGKAGNRDGKGVSSNEKDAWSALWAKPD